MRRHPDYNCYCEAEAEERKKQQGEILRQAKKELSEYEGNEHILRVVQNPNDPVRNYYKPVELDAERYIRIQNMADYYDWVNVSDLVGGEI